MNPVRAAFAQQARACDNLGSPFTARLMRLAAGRLSPGTEVADRLLGWPGDPSNLAESVPLRLAGSLHWLVLGPGAPELSALWPPAAPPDDDALWRGVEDAFVRHEAALLDRLESPPQTNEVRRAAALIPALHIVARLWGRPLALAELGASAGLNLQGAGFRLDAGAGYGPPESPVRLEPAWSGPAPPPAKLRIASRAGVDLRPIDATTAEGRRSLLSYIWPDQPDRLARTEAAIALMRGDPPDLAAGDAADWLEGWLDTPREAGRAVYTTVAWQYFPETTRRRCRAAMAQAGAQAPLALIQMEADGDQRGAGITLTLWPGGTRHVLGRVDFHGRWVDWTGVPALPEAHGT